MYLDIRLKDTFKNFNFGKFTVFTLLEGVRCERKDGFHSFGTSK